jgi:peptidoglycan/xylan/chitin deacetylase (PgdA/CDA1 family)
MSDPNKTYFSFTVDVDPDVNVPSQTQTGAVSHPVEGGKVRFDAVEHGLGLLTELLSELQIEATFFFEARTAQVLSKKLNLPALMHRHEVGCHSYEHEDFTATQPEVNLDRVSKLGLFFKSLDILHNIFPDHEIIGFRAPYIKIDLDLAILIEQIGFVYDSSVTANWDHSSKTELFKPRHIEGTNKKLKELQLPLWVGEGMRPLSSYLWPYLESERDLDEYIDNINQSVQSPDNELIILATHPWHLVETYKNGRLNDDEIENNFGALRKLLQNSRSLPATEFIRLDRYLDIAKVDPKEVVLEKKSD